MAVYSSLLHVCTCWPKSIDDFIRVSYEKAPQAKREIDKIADEIARGIGAKTAKPPLKKEAKVRQNIALKYDGDWTKVTDIARNTIVVSDHGTLARVADALESRPDIKAFKIVKASEDPLGYSGVNARVETSNGMLGEIQGNTSKMIYAKEKAVDARAILGDDVYEALDRKFNGTGGKGHTFYDEWAAEADLTKREAIKGVSKSYYKPFQD